MTRTTEPVATVQELRCTNDKNGNPRRAYVVSVTYATATRHPALSYAGTVATYDVGYTGEAFRTALADAMEGNPIPLVAVPSVQVTPEEYRTTLATGHVISAGAEEAGQEAADAIKEEVA